MLYLILYLLSNLLVLFLFLFLMTVAHENGHALILRAAGGKPKIKINILKGSKTIAQIPREHATKIQGLSALNAILHGYFVFLAYMLGVYAFNLAAYFVPASFGLLTIYVIGIRKDIKNIKKWRKAK